VFDIFIAILKIEKVSSMHKSADKLKHDFMAWDSVIREFEIIGEASKHLIEADIFNKEYRTIVDFRNILIHAYFGIDEDEVWHIIHHNLDDIKMLTEKVIGLLENDTKNDFIADMVEENSHHRFIVNALNKLNG
jgi:uncharacterized protein with HEPN domain